MVVAVCTRVAHVSISQLSGFSAWTVHLKGQNNCKTVSITQIWAFRSLVPILCEMPKSLGACPSHPHSGCPPGPDSH